MKRGMTNFRKKPSIFDFERKNKQTSKLKKEKARTPLLKLIN